MAFTTKINSEIRAYILYKKGSTNIRDLQRETGVSRAQIYRIWKSGIKGLRYNKMKHKGGRPSKLSKRCQDYILRELRKLRQSNPNQTIKALQERTNTFHISDKTMARFLHKNGYNYRQCRRKGLLSDRDLKIRRQFAKKMIRDHNCMDFWTQKIAFYFDGVCFVYKKKIQKRRRKHRKEAITQII